MYCSNFSMKIESVHLLSENKVFPKSGKIRFEMCCKRTMYLLCLPDYTYSIYDLV